jgi:hypothetical protein
LQIDPTAYAFIAGAKSRWAPKTPPCATGPAEQRQRVRMTIAPSDNRLMQIGYALIHYFGDQLGDSL